MSYGAIFGKTGKSGFYPTLTITPVGAVFTSVTATSSAGQEYNATQQDSQWFVQVNDFDTYTVTGNYTGGSVSQDIDVVVNQNYDVTLAVANPVLNENSWEDIKTISDTGAAGSIWAIGDAKQIILNGQIGGSLQLSNFSVYVFIIGFNHNAELEGSNRIHFQLGKTTASGGTDIALIDEEYQQNRGGSRLYMNSYLTTEGGWEDSRMRNTTLTISPGPTVDTAFIDTVPSDLRSVLKSVTKYTNNQGISADNVSATTDYLFLLSEYEVIGSVTKGDSYEANYQQQYAYYKDGNSKVKYCHDNTQLGATYWTRSPGIVDMGSNFVAINTIGNSSSWPANYSLGFAPAFCV